MRDFSQKQKFLDLCPLGILVVARDRQKLEVLYANPFFENLAKIKPVEGGLTDIWPGRQGKDLYKAVNSQILPETFVANLHDQWLKLGFQRVTWKGLDSVLIWADNISAIKEAVESLEKAVADADAAAESKSNFLATMSHEMRTPMQAVFGLLELIALEKPSQNILDMVAVAKGAAIGMLEILDDILDLAKMDAEKMELDMFEVPVRTLTRGVLEALSVKAQGRPIVLTDDIDKDVPFVIVGDPKRLRQILINLIGNALKFTEEGFVRVHITTKTEHLPPRDKGLNLRFEIIDSGIGMSESVQKKLFSSFTQADNSTARKFGGTGLGLSISKKLIEIMNGEIGVISEEGKGSTFWFEIPTEEINTDAQTLEMPDLSGISVLSVEDHPQGAKEIVNSLRSMGATVESCANYQDALRLVKRRPFDVAVVDQGLPDGLGIDLIREIMDIRPFMGIFMYTVRDDAGLQHSLQSLGIKYLAKPASRLGLGQNVFEAASKAARLEITGPTRLLIAEDTESVQDLIKRQLKTLGTEADFVMNGREALEALATGKYGILFTDLHMPEMDGYELVKTIREQETETGKHMPVIVLTADVQMAQRQVYLDHGFDECLLKPVSLGHFKRLLIRWGLLKETPEQLAQAATKAPAITSSAIDMQAIAEQMGAFDDSAKEMLGFFIDMTGPVLARLTKGQKDKDLHEVKEAAHSLKGAARSACATKLGDLAAEVQEKAEAGTLSDKLVEDILTEFEVVRKEIKRLVKV